MHAHDEGLFSGTDPATAERRSFSFNPAMRASSEAGTAVVRDEDNVEKVYVAVALTARYTVHYTTSCCHVLCCKREWHRQCVIALVLTVASGGVYSSRAWCLAAMPPLYYHNGSAHYTALH
jgi:hypothetical protein